jgi:hypothetical protein
MHWIQHGQRAARFPDDSLAVRGGGEGWERGCAAHRMPCCRGCGDEQDTGGMWTMSRCLSGFEVGSCIGRTAAIGEIVSVEAGMRRDWWMELIFTGGKLMCALPCATNVVLPPFEHDGSLVMLQVDDSHITNAVVHLVHLDTARVSESCEERLGGWKRVHNDWTSVQGFDCSLTVLLAVTNTPLVKLLRRVGVCLR